MYPPRFSLIFSFFPGCFQYFPDFAKFSGFPDMDNTPLRNWHPTTLRPISIVLHKVELVKIVKICSLRSEADLLKTRSEIAMS